MGKENRKLSDAEALSVIAAVKEKKWQDRVNPENESTTSSVEQESELESETEKENKPSKVSEESKRKRIKSSGYESLFLFDADTSSRNGKLVSIRTKHHDKIANIVHLIGKNDVSIFSYIDNVLSHHFETYQQDIKELVNKKCKDLMNQ